MPITKINKGAKKKEQSKRQQTFFFSLYSIIALYLVLQYGAIYAGII